MLRGNMNELIEKMYNFDFEAGSFFGEIADKTVSRREWALYESLYERLSEKDRKIFLEYVNLQTEEHEKELKAAYEQGFKTAVTLIVDCMKK